MGPAPLEGHRPRPTGGQFGLPPVNPIAGEPGSISSWQQYKAAPNQGLDVGDADPNDVLDFITGAQNRASQQTAQRQQAASERQFVDRMTTLHADPAFEGKSPGQLEAFARLEQSGDAAAVKALREAWGVTTKETAATKRKNIEQGGLNYRQKAEFDEAQKLRGIGATGDLAEDAVGDLDAADAAVAVAREGGDRAAYQKAAIRYADLVGEVTEKFGSVEQARAAVAAGRASREGERRIKAEAAETNAEKAREGKAPAPVPSTSSVTAVVEKIMANKGWDSADARQYNQALDIAQDLQNANRKLFDKLSTQGKASPSLFAEIAALGLL
jgi:hypothetical protein